MNEAQRSVTKTWSISTNRMPSEAVDILRTLVMFGNDAIPKDRAMKVAENEVEGNQFENIGYSNLLVEDHL